MDTRRRRNGSAAEAAAVKCSEDEVGPSEGLGDGRETARRAIATYESDRGGVAYVARAKALDDTGAGGTMGSSDCGAASRSLVAMAVGQDVLMIAEAGKGSGTTRSASGRLPGKGSGTTRSASGRLPELSATGRTAKYKIRRKWVNVWKHWRRRMLALHGFRQKPKTMKTSR